MLRFLFRALALFLLAGAFAALVVDGTRSIAADALTLTPLGQAAAFAFPAKFPLLEPAVKRLSPALWDPVLATVFLMPVWLVAGLVGAALFALTRRRRPLIGYSSR